MLENRILKIVQKLTPLATIELKEVNELVLKHGEYGLALENLCSIIEESDITINPEELQEILELFRIMDFDEKTISYYSRAIRTIT